MVGLLITIALYNGLNMVWITWRYARAFRLNSIMGLSFSCRFAILFGYFNMKFMCSVVCVAILYVMGERNLRLSRADVIRNKAVAHELYSDTWIQFDDDMREQQRICINAEQPLNILKMYKMFASYFFRPRAGALNVRLFSLVQLSWPYIPRVNGPSTYRS